LIKPPFKELGNCFLKSEIIIKRNFFLKCYYYYFTLGGMETNRLKSGRGSSELLLFRFSFLFLPPLLTDAFVTRKKERKRERRRRPLFCLLFFHLVYSRFDLHHRDDDDYLHFLEKEKYFTPKKWLKS
jgi:hypothetical protein